MIKAICKGFHIDQPVRCWSRHAVPIAFTHLCVSGPTGRAILAGLVEDASGLFIFGHPTLGLWSAGRMAKFKRPDGGVLHQFAGMTPSIPTDPEDIVDPETGETTTVIQQFAAKSAVEMYVLGHILRWTNCTAGDDTLYVGLGMTDASLLDAIKPSAIVFRSDTMAWADVPGRYKRSDGSPRVDVDDLHDTPEVRWVDPADVPPLVI